MLFSWSGKRTGNWFVQFSDRFFLLSSDSDCSRCGLVTCQTRRRSFLRLLNKSLSVAKKCTRTQKLKEWMCVREGEQEQVFLLTSETSQQSTPSWSSEAPRSVRRAVRVEIAAAPAETTYRIYHN